MSIISYPNIIKCRKEWLEVTSKKLVHLTTILQIWGWRKANKIGILGWEKLGYPEASKTDNIAECIGWKKAKLIEY